MVWCGIGTQNELNTPNKKWNIYRTNNICEILLSIVAYSGFHFCPFLLNRNRFKYTEEWTMGKSRRKAKVSDQNRQIEKIEWKCISVSLLSTAWEYLHLCCNVMLFVIFCNANMPTYSKNAQFELNASLIRLVT